MIDQIKVFSSLNPSNLETCVNSWLSDNPLISIISILQDCESGRLYLTIHYRITNDS